MWHSFTPFWYFGPRTSWAVQMALFAPQLISLTCSGSVLCFTDGCLCGKVMFCQHIYKCPFCRHTYWKLISMVNYCAHFSPVVLFTEYKARLCPLPLICSSDLWNRARGRNIFFFIRKESWKLQKTWGGGIKMFLHCILSDDLYLCLCSPECLQDSSIYMERRRKNRSGQDSELGEKKKAMKWIRLQSAKKNSFFLTNSCFWICLPYCAVISHNKTSMLAEKLFMNSVFQVAY